MGFIMKKIVALLTTIGMLLCTGTAFAKEMKISTWEDITSMDPGWMISSAREFVVLDSIYDGLVHYKEGTFEVVPQLATSWDQSADGKEIVFHLKKGVQFQKGYGEMTADDVKFSLDRVIAEGSDATEHETLKPIKEVIVVDQYTVKLVLETPMSALFTSILPGPSGMIVSKKAAEEMGREKFSQNPIGTGPYQFVSWEPKKKLLLEKFDGYWGEAAKSDKVSFNPIVEDTTAEIAMKTRAMDVGRSAIQNLDSFKKNKRLQVVTKPDLRYWFIGFTQNKAPFDNKDLREAVRWAIDVDKALDAAFFGGAERAKTVVPPGVPGHLADVELRSQDFAKAKEALKRAGKPDGFKATVNVFIGDVPKIVAEVIKADCAKVGIELELVVQESGAATDANLAGTYDMFIDVWSTTTDPSDSTLWWMSDNKWNFTHWNNPAFDKAVTSAMAELDGAKRDAFYQQAQRIMEDEAWAIMLTHGTRIVVAQKNVDLGPVYPNGNLAPWAISFK